MDIQIADILCRALGPHVGEEMTPERAAQIVAQVAMKCYPGPVDTEAVEPLESGSYVIQCERLQSNVAGLSALHYEHWMETEGHHAEAGFNPDYQRGVDLEAQGRYLLIVARERATGRLVANYGLYLARSMHSQQLIATEDTLFVARAHRSGPLGIRLIRYAEAALRLLGCTELNVSVKLVNKVGPMIERMGYEPTSTLYTKILME